MNRTRESKRSKRSRFLRDKMVDVQIAGRGVRNKRVLTAMRKVPRELFMEKRVLEVAYDDSALPIGKEETVSQPYIVAKILEAAAINESDRILDVGAGSGYLTALAAHLGREVCAMERHEALVDRARSRLRHLGCSNVDLRQGDGSKGWPDGGEFDAILVSAASAEIPETLQRQLSLRGRLVMPMKREDGRQCLLKITRRSHEDFVNEELELVSFVPLVPD